MSRRIIRLTESDLIRLVKRIISEEEDTKKEGKLTFRNVFSKARQAASYIKNQMSDDEIEDTLDFADEYGFNTTDAKKAVSKTREVDPEQLQRLEDAGGDALTESYLIYEGIGKKVAARLATTLGAPVSLVLAIAMIAADTTGWSEHPWTTYLHQFIDNNIGDARGFVVVLLFISTFFNLIYGLANWNAGKDED